MRAGHGTKFRARNGVGSGEEDVREGHGTKFRARNGVGSGEEDVRAGTELSSAPGMGLGVKGGHGFE